MSRMTDRIEVLLKQALDANDGRLSFSRAALATDMNCVPSQISYVLQTRFTAAHGYHVESRRGGGGFILLHRIAWQDRASEIMHVVNSLPERLSLSETEVYVRNLQDNQVISMKEGALLRAAVSRRALTGAAEPNRLRSSILCTMLLSLLAEAQA